MWNRNTLRSDLDTIFRSHVQPGTEVTDASLITGDLGIDSLGVMEVVADIEDKFGLTIPDDALPSLRTVGDVARGIEEMLAQDGRLS